MKKYEGNSIDYKICTGVNWIEDAGSCSDKNKRSVQREKYENLTIGICGRNAAINTQEYYAG